jgi:uncharacterized protein YdaU (DUF1376 family)
MPEKVDIFMPWFFGDYIKDTAELTAEEHGAYLLLLGHMWNRGGRLPSDPLRLARLAAVAQERWGDVWSAIRRFFTDDDGEITQKRLAEELDKALGNRRKASEKGRKGALAKAALQAQAHPGSSQGTSTGTAPAAPQLEAGVKSGSSSSPSPPDPDLSPPPEISDPDAREPAAPGRDVTGLTLIRIFGVIRSEMVGGLPWQSIRAPEKASDMADAIAADPAACEDVKPTMRLLFSKAKSGRLSKSAEILRDPSFAFGAWCSQFTALREEHRRVSPRGPAAAASEYRRLD